MTSPLGNPPAQPYPAAAPGPFQPPVPPKTRARRWGARWIDWFVPWLLTAPLWFITVEMIQSKAGKDGVRLAGTGLFRMASGNWGSLGDTADEALADYWGTVVGLVAGTLAIQVLLIMASEVVLLRWCGRTLGKAAFSLSVLTPGGEKRLSFGQACGRTAFTVLLPGMAWILLIAAVLKTSLLLAFAGIVLLTCSAVECLLVRASPDGQTCWHDRRAGSVVVPKTWSEQLRQVRDAQRRMFEQSRELANQAWNAPPVRQLAHQAQTAFQQAKESDIAARAVQRSKNLAGHVRDSRLGRAAQDRLHDARRPAPEDPDPPD